GGSPAGSAAKCRPGRPRVRSQPTTAPVKGSLPDVTTLRGAPEHPVAFRGQPAHQPVGLDRISRPGLGPAVGDARRDRLLGNLAAVVIEQREFSTGLIEAALKIAPLRDGRPHGRLIGVFNMTGG